MTWPWTVGEAIGTEWGGEQMREVNKTTSPDILKVSFYERNGAFRPERACRFHDHVVSSMCRGRVFSGRDDVPCLCQWNGIGDPFRKSVTHDMTGTTKNVSESKL